MDVGKKIKQIRIYKKMTQAELSEGIITRNMLSAIETSKALPSLTVLRMLSDRLGVSCDILLSDDELDLQGTIALKKKMPQLKKLFYSKKYKELYDLLTEFENVDDLEIAYMMAVTSFHLAIDAFYEGNSAECRKFISKSEKFFSDSGFAPGVSYCNLFNRISQSVFSEAIPSLAECVGNDTHLPELFFYVYIVKLIKSGQEDKAADVYDSVKFTYDPLRYHINSLFAASKFNISRAKELLIELIDQNPNIPVPFKKMIYNELEHYCTVTGDYKKAYECAVEKNNMAKIV